MLARYPLGRGQKTGVLTGSPSSRKELPGAHAADSVSLWGEEQGIWV